MAAMRKEILAAAMENLAQSGHGGPAAAPQAEKSAPQPRHATAQLSHPKETWAPDLHERWSKSTVFETLKNSIERMSRVMPQSDEP